MTRTLAAPAWFEAWFDTPDYHRLYAGRDDREAEAFVTSLIGHLHPLPEARMLDLGCGSGRHARVLAGHGFDVTGMDLAANSIREARRYETDRLRFRRHDMRDPFGSDRFECVFSFFTSFGYFDGDEHDQVVANMANALKADGMLVLDYLNVGYSEHAMVPAEEKVIRDHRYRIARWSDASHFFKRIEIEGAGETHTYVEKVAKFRLADFGRLFERHGLHIESVFGDYGLGPYDEERSPRLILVAHKRVASARRAA